MVDVAVVDVALNAPNVGVLVATIAPLEFVERSELIATPPRVSVLLKIFVPLHMLFVVVPKPIERALLEICRGYVEEIILFRNAVFQSLDDAVTVLYELFQFVELARTVL